MDSKTYKDIVHLVRSHKGLASDSLTVLKGKFPQVSKDCLYSILIMEHQKRMKANHIKTEKMRNRYWRLYKDAIYNGDKPGVILKIAQEVNVAPCLIAKLILQKHLEECGETKNKNHLKINDYMRNSSLINDMALSYEVFLCTMYDILYSPLAETAKHSLGQQYEIKLVNEITKLGLAFRDEEQLRMSGYDKTPDIKLEVPIAIDGFIVNWIESKAWFGDPHAHKEYVKNQYSCYWNRFGSGLIIYWFGYLKSIVDPNDKFFMISDHMPTENIVFITPPKIKKCDNN